MHPNPWQRLVATLTRTYGPREILQCTTGKCHYKSHSVDASAKQTRRSVPTCVQLEVQTCVAAHTRSANMLSYFVTRSALPSPPFCPQARGVPCTGCTNGARHALPPVLSADQRAPALKVVPCSSVTALRLAKTHVVHHLYLCSSGGWTACKSGHIATALPRAHQPGCPAHRQQCAALGEREARTQKAASEQVALQAWSSSRSLAECVFIMRKTGWVTTKTYQHCKRQAYRAAAWKGCVQHVTFQQPRSMQRFFAKTC